MFTGKKLKIFFPLKGGRKLRRFRLPVSDSSRSGDRETRLGERLWPFRRSKAGRAQQEGQQVYRRHADRDDWRKMEDHEKPHVAGLHKRKTQIDDAHNSQGFLLSLEYSVTDGSRYLNIVIVSASDNVWTTEYPTLPFYLVSTVVQNCTYLQLILTIG